ncbi:hypothetical protein [Hymenobacter cellulosivorans]|uniref:Uncharacterized protein n=1 Tax=Hymenobacter cellulosivorans TaxID=2932249 RepID=A0ABY4F841_9BACT|nr:hypothetical protein [Hymenobacter cellulosivorans]UOQ52580.1 hypothetical protein MUN80_22865 [Hymenobacter cellulosivorans]
MRLVSFKQLPMGQQADVLRRSGHFLSDRRQDSFELQLYALGDFYAEVWRGKGEEHILFIHLFQDSHNLMPYLESIRLPEV